MKETTVAARYARALYIVTEKRGETERALKDLKLLLPILGAETPVGRQLASPQVMLAEKRAVVGRALEMRALRSVALFVDLLLRKKRLREFDTMVAEFDALVEKKHGIQRAHVVSAVPLTDEERKALHAALEKRTGGRIELATEVDPGIIAGAHVRIGDRLVDRSAKTLLERMEQLMMETVV